MTADRRRAGAGARAPRPSGAKRSAGTAPAIAPQPAQPVLEVRVYWQQIPGQLADRFSTECVIDPKAGSLVRGLAALYAQGAVLEQLAEQNLLGDDLMVAIRKVAK
jgi:hypothetical protein